MEEKVHLFVLGATGFIGGGLVRQALAQGLRVTALARSAERAAGLKALGARVVIGDARNPAEWIPAAAGCDVLIDLLQPELPARIGLRAIRRAAAIRQAMTSRLLDCLRSIPQSRRPRLVSVSGVDDLTPDKAGNIDDSSVLRTQLSGFAHIGVPIRRLIEASGLESIYVYLGTVYGPGKSFASKVFPDLAAGRFRLPGKGANRMAVVHVEDAARALIHIASLERGHTSGHTFVVTDGHPATLGDFMGFAAECLGGPHPKTAPLWLARLFAGNVLLETLTRDIAAHPAALIRTGFRFKYPTYRDGLPPSVKEWDRTSMHKAVSVLDRQAVFAALSVLTIGVFLAIHLLSFPLSLSYMKRLAAGATILDMRPGYTPAAAYQLFDALGRTGRSAYLTVLWTIDLLLPALFSTFLSAAIRRGAFRAWRSVPFFAAAVDYAENIAITFLLLLYPARRPVLVYIAATLTVVKLLAYGTAVLLSAGGALVRFLRLGRQSPARLSAILKNVNESGHAPVWALLVRRVSISRSGRG